MDDMFIYIGISILFEWLHICGLSQPTLSESSEARHLDTFVAEITNHAEQLLITLCAHLTKILQFSGFRLKMFKTRCQLQATKIG